MKNITKEEILEMNADQLCELVGDDFYPDNYGAPAIVVAEANIAIGDDLINVAFYLGDRKLDNSSVYELDNIAYIKLNGDIIK